MKELFLKARMYGQVSIYTYDDGGYCCTIKFRTKSHISLEAKGRDEDVEKCIQKAIDSAIEIVNSVSKEFDDLKSNPLVLQNIK